MTNNGQLEVLARIARRGLVLTTLLAALFFPSSVLAQVNSTVIISIDGTTLSVPTGVAQDPLTGNIYQVDIRNCAVYKTSTSGGTTVIAGTPGNCTPASGATPTTFAFPIDVATCAGNVYFATHGVDPGIPGQPSGTVASGGGIYKIDQNGNLTILPTPTTSGGALSPFFPVALACDNTGNVFVASYFYGQEGVFFGTVDEIPLNSQTSKNFIVQFDTAFPGIAVDGKDNVFVLETAAGVGWFGNALFGLGNIWELTGGGGSTVIPSVARSTGADAQQTTTNGQILESSASRAIDSSGNFYITQAATSGGPTTIVTSVPVGGGTLTTIAGNGTAGFSGDGGTATQGEMNSPTGITVGVSGILVADSGNGAIRRVFSEPATLAKSDSIPNFSLNSAVNPTTQKLYVAVSKGNFTGPVMISLPGSTDDTVVTNIPLPAGTTVSYITADTVNNVIYASSQNGTVTVIDGATDTINATLTVGRDPLGIAVDPGLNTAFVSNSDDSFFSIILGPVRNSSGTITTNATVSPTKISNILPLGAIGVDTTTHTVYAIVDGPANPGSLNYTLAIINGATLSLTNTVSYLNNAGSTNIAADALAVDQQNGMVVIADSEDQAVRIYDPVAGGFRQLSQSFFPTHIAMDSVDQVAYAFTGYGNVTEINLLTSAQTTVATPPFPATSPETCGPGGTSVAADSETFQAYFTTCDGTNGAFLKLWDGASQSLTFTSPTLGNPTNSLNSVSGDFGVVINSNSANHIAYVANSIPTIPEIDIFNGPTPAARPSTHDRATHL